MLIKRLFQFQISNNFGSATLDFSFITYQLSLCSTGKMRRWSQTFIGRQANPRPTCPVFIIIIIINIVALLRNPSIKTSLRLSRIFHFTAMNSCCCCCCCGLYQAQQGNQLVPNTTSPPQLATRLYLLYTFYLYCRAGSGNYILQTRLRIFFDRNYKSELYKKPETPDWK